MLLRRLSFRTLWFLTVVFTVTVTLANNSIFNETHVPTVFIFRSLDMTRHVVGTLMRGGEVAVSNRLRRGERGEKEEGQRTCGAAGKCEGGSTAPSSPSSFSPRLDASALYCSQGLAFIEDDDEYAARIAQLPVTLPRPGHWLVYADDASPEQSTIALPWRREGQLSEMDKALMKTSSTLPREEGAIPYTHHQLTLCDAHPYFFRYPCHYIIAPSTSIFPFLFPAMQRMAYASHSVYATYLYYRWRLDCSMLSWEQYRQEKKKEEKSTLGGKV